MSTDLVVTAPAVTNDQLALIKATVAKDATTDELKLYLYDCARIGVHPLDKLLHFTKRSGKYTPITSIDLMRIRAAETGELAGSDDPEFTGTPAQNDFTARVTVWRLVQGTRCAFSATARWSEYKPDQAFMWNKMPHTMLGKCAEALALRKGFPRQLAGLYAKEEMDQAEKGEKAGVYTKTVPAALTNNAKVTLEVNPEEDALPLDQHILKAIKPSKDKLIVGTAVTHRGEELHIVKADILAIAEELVKTGQPMLGITAMKNGRTFVREFMSPEAQTENPVKPGPSMVTADDLSF
jgi:phage recombination protein Bet